VDWSIRRGKMVEDLLAARGIRDERILAAFRDVPRHLFVEEALAPKAYGDHPLPIAERQTISQPWIVARMLLLAGIGPSDRVLEIGTGSGYQTALLGRLAAQVYSIERHAALARGAVRVLRRLNLDHVHVKTFDGTYGWSEFAPYQAIIVSAAAPSVPGTLTDQLAEGGRLVIPIGSEKEQRLHVVTRRGDTLDDRAEDPVTFLPLVGKFGWPEAGGAAPPVR